MKIRRWQAAIAIAAVLVLFMAVRPPLFYYVNFTLSPRALPTRLIRPAFAFVAEHPLPEKADELRAIFHGGRDPSIFVRFRMDSEGIQTLLDMFSESDFLSKARTRDADSLRGLAASGATLFYAPSQWQKRLGICLFDQASFRAGREFEYTGFRDRDIVCTILIDDAQSIVYIHAIAM